MPAGEISIRAVLHPNPLGRWITFPVTVGGVLDLAMVLDSGSPFSAISPETARELGDLDLLAPAQDSRYHHRLTTLSVEGQELPDLDVIVLPRLTRLRIAGLLGLDFLSQFAAIHFYVDARRLVLERR